MRVRELFSEKYSEIPICCSYFFIKVRSLIQCSGTVCSQVLSSFCILRSTELTSYVIGILMFFFFVSDDSSGSYEAPWCICQCDARWIRSIGRTGVRSSLWALRAWCVLVVCVLFQSLHSFVRVISEAEEPFRSNSNCSAAEGVPHETFFAFKYAGKRGRMCKVLESYSLRSCVATGECVLFLWVCDSYLLTRII